MRCPRCDSELEEGQKFCHKCGMRMEVRPEEKQIKTKETKKIKETKKMKKEAEPDLILNMDDVSGSGKKKSDSGKKNNGRKKKDDKINWKIAVPVTVGCMCAVTVLAAIPFLKPASHSSADLQKKLSMGSKYLASADYENAEKVFTEALKIDKKSSDAAVGLAKVYNKNKEPEKALKMLEKATDNAGILSDKQWQTRKRDYQMVYEQTAQQFKDKGDREKAAQIQIAYDRAEGMKKREEAILANGREESVYYPVNPEYEDMDFETPTLDSEDIDAAEADNMEDVPELDDEDIDNAEAEDEEKELESEEEDIDNIEEEDGEKKPESDDEDIDNAEAEDEEKKPESEEEDIDNIEEEDEDKKPEPDDKDIDNAEAEDEEDEPESGLKIIYESEAEPEPDCEIDIVRETYEEYPTDGTAWEENEESWGEVIYNNETEPGEVIYDNETEPGEVGYDNEAEPGEVINDNEPEPTEPEMTPDELLDSYASANIQKTSLNGMSAAPGSMNGTLGIHKEDLNGDGIPELLVVKMESGRIAFDIYRVDGNAVTMGSSSASIGNGFGSGAPDMSYGGTQECFIMDNGGSVDVGIASHYYGLDAGDGTPSVQTTAAVYSIGGDGSAQLKAAATIVNGNRVYENGNASGAYEGDGGSFCGILSAAGLSGSWIYESADALAAMNLAENPYQDMSGVPNPVESGIGSRESGVRDLVIVNAEAAGGSPSMSIYVQDNT